MLVFIRHAEKVHWDPVHLSERGAARARLLADYFRHPCGLFGVPSVLVAMADRRAGHSRRCTETLGPTADRLGLEMITRYPRGKGSKAVRKAVREIWGWDWMWGWMRRWSCRKKTAVICWEHSELPAMVQALGFPQVVSWGLHPDREEHQDEDRDCFDATWVVDLERGELRVYRQFDVVWDERGKGTWVAQWPWPHTVPTCVLYKK